jgi:hypothetical protein
MAYLVADADGDWTAAATWKVANATGTTLLDAQTGGNVLTTAFVSSQAFTPGAITVAGLCVKVATNTISGAATVSVRLAVGGVAVAGTTVTINQADMPASMTPGGNTFRSCSLGWVYFKFAAPVTLIAATAYTLQATCSVLNRVTLYRDATGSNWSRLLVTTTTATPAAGDSMFVLGAHTGAGATTSRVVTMNETAATDYGSASTILASLGVGHAGSLLWNTSGAATYRLRLSGVFQVWVNGTFRIGTASTPIPRAASAILEFDCAADADFGFFTWGAHSLYGESRTSGKSAVLTRLNTDEAVGQTTLGVADDTGWLSGDRVIIGSTTRLNAETEVRVLNGAAGASSLDITVGLTNAHSGTTGSQAEVALIERNVIVRAVTPAATFYWIDRDPGTLPDLGWVLWENHGAGANIEFELGGASAVYSRTFQSCAWYGFEQSVVAGTNPAAGVAISFLDCVAYCTVTTIQFSKTASTVDTVVTGGAYFGTGANRTCGFDVAVGAFTADDVQFCGTSIQLGPTTVEFVEAVFTNCEFHSTPTNVPAMSLGTTNQIDCDVRTSRFWRCGNAGFGAAAVTFQLSGQSAAKVTFEDCQFVGNACSMGCGTSGLGGYGITMRVIDCDFEQEIGFTGSNHITISTQISAWMEFHNCRFSQAGPVPAVDIGSNGAPMAIRSGGGFLFNHTLFGAATPFSTAFRPTAGGGFGNYYGTGRLSFMREGGIANAHTSQFGNGIIDYQVAVFHDSAPCEDLQPVGATTFWPLLSAEVFKPCAAGQSVTFSVWVRKSAAYTGTAPRVRVLANGNSGWNDTVVAMTAAADTWEELTVTVGPADDDGVAVARIECDGSAGNVYVDDWSASVA